MRTYTEQALSGAPSAPGWQDVLKGLIGAAGEALPLYQQQQLYKMQLDRAARGLPPIPASAVAPAGIPVHVQLDRRLVWLIGGGLAIAGIAAYFALRNRRR